MIEIATHEAKTHLSKYLSRVEAGETIVILRGKRPLAKLVPYEESGDSGIPKVGQTMDARMEIPSQAFEPLDAVELKEWGL